MIIGEIDLIGAKCPSCQFKIVRSINGILEKKLHSFTGLEVEGTRIILDLVNHSQMKKSKDIQNCEKEIGQLQKKLIKRWLIIQDFGSDLMQQIWVFIIQNILKLQFGSQKEFYTIQEKSCKKILKKDSALMAVEWYHLKSILNINTSLYWKQRLHLGKEFNGWVLVVLSFFSKIHHSTSGSTMSGSHGFTTSL